MSGEPAFSVTRRDLTIDWFSGTGAGGQHRNKHQNCCRVTHPASGARAVGQGSRSRRDNLREALGRLAKNPRFLAYCRERLGASSAMAATMAAMASSNLLVEVREDGRWVPEDRAQKGESDA